MSDSTRVKMTDLNNLCADIRGISVKTADFIRGETGLLTESDIRAKGYHDFVSRVDIESEKMLTVELRRLMPEASFVTEEGTVKTGEGRFRWVIDPLDGTTNYMHSLPPFSISIALCDKDSIVAGMVYDIVPSNAYWAFKGGGAWCNDEPISVSVTNTLGSALVATGFPYREFDRLKEYLATLETFIRSTHGVRRMGSAAIDLAYVACGRFDGFFEYNLNPWDVTAGVLLVNEAGGTTSGFAGSGDGSSGREIVASNGKIHEHFRAIVFKNMGTKTEEE